MNKNIFVEKTLKLIEIALLNNDKATAALLSENAATLVNDKRLNNFIINHK